jgi:hypothetical protein
MPIRSFFILLVFISEYLVIFDAVFFRPFFPVFTAVLHVGDSGAV